MMGRSHALLGAVGYSVLEPIAKVSMDESIPGWVNTYLFPIGTIVSIVILVVAPMRFTAKYEIMIPPEGSPTYKSVFGAGRYLYNWSRSVVVILSVGMMVFGVAHYVYSWNPALLPSSPPEKLLLLVVAAGFALLPDMDEPKSTVNQVFGPIAVAVSHFTRKAAGGHRNGTHSWVMIGIGLILGLLTQTSYLIASVVVVFSFILAGRMLMPISRQIAFYPAAGIGILAAGIMWATNMDTTPLLLAVPLGIFLHDLGDLPTNSGIRFFWPHPRKFALKWFSTNSATEHAVIQPLLGLSLIAVMVFWIILPFFQLASTGDGSGIMSDYHGVWNAK